ncbi:UNVERIFIED_CONTAM: hypothetical protein FKN15_071023 [Acipenser sinensis]
MLTAETSVSASSPTVPLGPSCLRASVLRHLNDLQPRHLCHALASSVPRGLDVFEVFKLCASVPWCSIALVPRCFGNLDALRPRHIDAFEAFKPCALVPSVPQRSIASASMVPRASVLWHPQCLEDTTLRCFDILGTLHSA